MPNTLALIGDSIKSTATAIVPRLSFGANQSRGAITYGGFMGNALIQTANFGGGGAQAGYDYDALLTDPLQNSVVAACVDVITRAIAEAPLMLETKKGAEWERVESHAALDLFRANPHLSDSEIWGVTAAHKATRGLGYWVVFYNDAKTKPTEIWPWAPEKVRAISDSKDFIGAYEVQDEAGEWKTLPSEQVIQFRHLPNVRDLRGGWCPLFSGQVQMVGDNAVSTYNTAILLNAGVMSLLISIKAGEAQGRSIEVTPTQFQEWIDRLRRKHIGNKASAGGIEGTTLPLEVTKMAFSPDEMSVEKLEGIFMTRLHALLGVSPKLTGMGPDATYLNQAEAINDFWERRIVPERNKDADTLNRQLLPLLGLDGDKWRFRFDFSNVAALQENTDGLFNRWRELFKAGGCDLYTLQTKLSLADVPDEFKGRFFGQGNGQEVAPDAAAAEVKAVEKWDEADHPRADDGKFGDGGVSFSFPVIEVSEAVYHGTNRESAAYIQESGVGTDVRHKGGISNDEAGFTFVSPIKAVARYYAEDNTVTARHGGAVVLEGHLSGRLIEFSKPISEAGAIAEIAKEMGAYDHETHIYDARKVQAELKKKGIAGFKFKDRHAGNRLAYGIVDTSGLSLSKEVKSLDSGETYTMSYQTKAADTTAPQPLAPWTDAELDEMTEQFTPADVKESLALRTGEMREILEAKNE